MTDELDLPAGAELNHESEDALDAELERVLGQGADPAGLADELFAVVDALDGNPSLRRTLTDPGLPGPARRAVAERLLGQQLAASSLAVVGAAVGQRWSSVGDLAAAVERLGVRALLVGAERAGGLDVVEDQLFRFERVVTGDHALRDALADRSVPVARRASLVTGILQGKADQATVALAARAVRARDRTFARTMERYLGLAADLRNRAVATVRVARPIDAEQSARLQAALSKHAGRAIALQVIVDPSIIGGARVELGNEVIEGSIAARLDNARRTIR